VALGHGRGIHVVVRAREREAGDNKDDAAHGVLRSGSPILCTLFGEWPIGTKLNYRPASSAVQRQMSDVTSTLKASL
jgi:hypothetical protein